MNLASASARGHCFCTSFSSIVLRYFGKRTQLGLPIIVIGDQCRVDLGDLVVFCWPNWPP